MHNNDQEAGMNRTQTNVSKNAYYEQELRIALVMNGGVSLAVWIGGVTQEINRLVRGETVYGRLCEALWFHRFERLTYTKKAHLPSQILPRMQLHLRE